MAAAFEASINVSRKPTGGPLERALDGIGCGSSSTGETPGGLTSRKGAAARRMLVLAVKNNPEHFINFFETAINESFRSDMDKPGRVGARDYLEYRSTLGPHRATIQWMWAIAGVYDTLPQGLHHEAQAR